LVTANVNPLPIEDFSYWEYLWTIFWQGQDDIFQMKKILHFAILRRTGRKGGIKKALWKILNYSV